jgi:hypothetical protein
MARRDDLFGFGSFQMRASITDEAIGAIRSLPSSAISYDAVKRNLDR